MDDPERIREQWITLIEKEEPILGRYYEVKRLSSSAGSGHFSLMFRALDSESRQNVALKLFSPLRIDNEYRLACFNRECEILTSFQGSKNIVQVVGGRQVLTVGLVHEATGIPVEHRIPFFAMELADSSVREWLYQTDPDPITALQYFHQMCKSVQRIHLSNLCHRDIKPSNFLIFRRSDICLTDFGTARYLDDRSPAFKEKYELPVGDLRYASPELFLGVGGNDPLYLAADMFALGAILFELFTKVVLTSQIFDAGYRNVMESVQLGVQRLREEEKRELRKEIIAGMAATVRLPSIVDYDSIAPPSVRSRIDSLYQSLCCLDYRERPHLHDFPSIFRQVGICCVILANQARYEAWLQQKRFRRQRRAERRGCAQRRRDEGIESGE